MADRLQPCGGKQQDTAAIFGIDLTDDHAAGLHVIDVTRHRCFGREHLEIGCKLLVGDRLSGQPAVRDDAEDHVRFEDAAPRPPEYAGRHHRAAKIRSPLQPCHVDAERRALLRVERAGPGIQRLGGRGGDLCGRKPLMIAGHTPQPPNAASVAVQTFAEANFLIGILPRQLLVLHAMRNDRVLTHTAHLLVVLEVALAVLRQINHPTTENKLV